MTLRDRINEDMKNAMRAREAEKLGALRLLLAAMKQREVDERITLDDAAVVSVIEKMMKQRRDSIEQYEKAQRQDLADKEKYEMSVLQGYLPQGLSQGEIESRLSGYPPQSPETQRAWRYWATRAGCASLLDD